MVARTYSPNRDEPAGLKTPRNQGDEGTRRRCLRATLRVRTAHKFNKMDYIGVIIEESLENKDVLKKIKILSTKIEPVTNKHKTPWLKQWTVHTIEISPDKAAKIAIEISKCLESAHNWYADFKNGELHFIIFRNKVFRIDRASKAQYDQAKKYGVSLGIPKYQVDFHPDIKQWKG